MTKRRLAIRFLLARKRRTVLTALGVTFGVALIVAMTVLGATLQASITEQLRQGFGSYDIMAGYDAPRLMSPAEQAQLERLPGIKYSVGILYLSGAGGNRLNYIGIGQFPEGEFAYPVREGRRPAPGAAEFAAELRMVEALGLRLGESTTLTFQGQPRQVTLVGLLPSTGKSSSDSLIFALDWLQQQMGLGDQVSLRVYGLHDPTEKAVVGANMRMQQPNLHLELRTELDEVRENMGGLKPMAIAFGLAGLVAAAFLVAGSFTVAVQERGRELALLRAVGADPGQVLRLVLGEAALLGAVGAAAGVAGGIAIAWGALGAAASSLGVAAHAPVLPPVALGLEWAAGVALALVAARRPARAASRLPPLQAMRPDVRQEAATENAGSRLGLVVMGIGVSLSAAALMVGDNGARALLGALGGLSLAVGILLALPRILPAVVGWIALPLEPHMPVETLLAVRGITRHRRRSAHTAATLVLGIMLTYSITTVFATLARNDREWVRKQFPGDAQVETHLPDQEALHAQIARRLHETQGVTDVTEMERAVAFRYDHAQRAAVLARVRQMLREPAFALATLRDLTDALAQSRQMTNQRFAILGAVIAAIFTTAAFGLVNAVLAGIHQRKRELLTFRTLGATPGQVRRQIVLEAVLLGLGGSLLGLLAGAAFIGGVGVGLEMPARDLLHLPLALVCAAAGPLLGALAAWSPASAAATAPFRSQEE